MNLRITRPLESGIELIQAAGAMRMPRQISLQTKFVLVESGRRSFDHQGNLTIAHPGVLIVLPPDTVHGSQAVSAEPTSVRILS